MAIHIQLKIEKIMRIVFAFILVSSWVSSKGQVDTVKIGTKSFQDVSLANDFTIYRALCENSDDYLFASQFIIRYDSITQVGYLSSYNYSEPFSCRERFDNDVEKFKMLLSESNKLHNKVCILFSMEDKRQKFIALLLLFSKKAFKKFREKAQKVSIRNYDGEKGLTREYNYDRYAKQFILTEVGDKL